MNIGIWRTKSNPFQKPPLPKWLIEWSIKQTPSMTQASMGVLESGVSCMGFGILISQEKVYLKRKVRTYRNDG